MIDLTPSDFPLNAGYVPLFPVACAWCLQEAGLPMGDGSHGICPDHAEKVLATWRARKREQKMFKSAKQAGTSYANTHMPEYELEESCIVQAMIDNPYTSPQAKQDFVDGVSERINERYRSRVHRQVYGE